MFISTDGRTRVRVVSTVDRGSWVIAEQRALNGKDWIVLFEARNAPVSPERNARRGLAGDMRDVEALLAEHDWEEIDG